ncbi:hypothetical protein GE061_002241 [Apolygus lucorum]|uniref:Uncharacterized protein n=1 Tax=Apolygus lucorum TaxID=248454 RepID=A0A8S9X4L4_APOLU|nr:hypothetical protein GE061_002241 [Apolygus lucorum]
MEPLGTWKNLEKWSKVRGKNGARFMVKRKKKRLQNVRSERHRALPRTFPFSEASAAGWSSTSIYSGRRKEAIRRRFDRTRENVSKMLLSSIRSSKMTVFGGSVATKQTVSID